MSFEALLTALPWSNLGWATIIVLVVLLILRGDLVTRKVHEDMVNVWKEAYDKQEQRGDVLEEALDKLTDGMDTVVRIVQALPSAEEEVKE